MYFLLIFENMEIEQYLRDLNMEVDALANLGSCTSGKKNGRAAFLASSALCSSPSA